MCRSETPPKLWRCLPQKTSPATHLPSITQNEGHLRCADGSLNGSDKRVLCQSQITSRHLVPQPRSLAWETWRESLRLPPFCGLCAIDQSHNCVSEVGWGGGSLYRNYFKPFGFWTFPFLQTNAACFTPSHALKLSIQTWHSPLQQLTVSNIFLNVAFSSVIQRR